jgi:hypothetical protein
MSKVPGVLHAAGSVLFILCGIAHTIGQYSSISSVAPIEKTMRETIIAGTTMNYLDVMQCWGAFYGAMTILFGVMLFVAVNAAGGSAQARKPVAVTGAIAAIVQAGCALFYSAPPPAFFMIPAALLLLASAFWPEPRTA